MPKHYTLLYRPPFSFALPRQQWTLVERPDPAYGFEKRTDLPLSVHKFGVVRFASDLTQSELDAFELIEVP